MLKLLGCEGTVLNLGFPPHPLMTEYVLGSNLDKASPSSTTIMSDTYNFFVKGTLSSKGTSILIDPVQVFFPVKS